MWPYCKVPLNTPIIFVKIIFKAAEITSVWFWTQHTDGLALQETTSRLLWWWQSETEFIICLSEAHKLAIISLTFTRDTAGWRQTHTEMTLNNDVRVRFPCLIQVLVLIVFKLIMSGSLIWNVWVTFTKLRSHSSLFNHAGTDARISLQDLSWFGRVCVSDHGRVTSSQAR